GGLLYYIALAFQTLLERNGLNRLSSITIIILIFTLSAGITGYFAVPMISDESRKLIMRWPAFQQELESMAGYSISQRESLPDFMINIIDNMIGVVSDSIYDAVSAVISIVTVTVTILCM